VSTDGDIETIKTATEMVPQYDGYVDNHKKRKTGYGDRFPSDAREVISPYITDEEADRLKHRSSIEYAQDILPDSPWGPSDRDYPSPERSATSLKKRTELESDGSRIHVLEGTVASSFSMESGYVELLMEYFREEDCLLLNFGRNYGGYIWFSGDQIDEMMTEFSSLADRDCIEFAGRGYVESSLPAEYNQIRGGLEQEETDTSRTEQKALPGTGTDAETAADGQISPEAKKPRAKTEADEEIPPKPKKPRPSYADGVESDVSVEIISKVDI